MVNLEYFSRLQDATDLEWEIYASETAGELEQTESVASQPEPLTAPEEIVTTEDDWAYPEQATTPDSAQVLLSTTSKKDLKKKKKKGTSTVPILSD